MVSAVSAGSTCCSDVRVARRESSTPRRSGAQTRRRSAFRAGPAGVRAAAAPLDVVTDRSLATRRRSSCRAAVTSPKR